MKVVDLIQGSKEWHAWRGQGIGSSDIAAIMGVSPYKTLRDLFLEKQGKLVPDEGKEFIFNKGHVVEKQIRKDYNALTGLMLVPACAEHSVRSEYRASFDGLELPRKRGLEAKLVGKDALEKVREGIIPDHHKFQLYWDLYISDFPVWDYFAHDGKKHGVLVSVAPDEKIMAQMLEEAQLFQDALSSNSLPALTPADTMAAEGELAVLMSNVRCLKEAADRVVAAYEAEREKLIASAPHNKIAGGGMTLTKVLSKGRVDYSNIPEIQNLDLDKYRSKDTISWRINVEKVRAT